jgi:Carbohydrate esterase, sialic acid-specific acetylesterase
MIYTHITSFQLLQRNQENVAYVYVNDTAVPYGVGGPYTIGDAHGVYVGDIWFLSGQSNMRGWGNFRDVPGASTVLAKPDSKVHSFQSCESWAPAKEPIHNLAESIRSIHKTLRDPSNGGPNTPRPPPSGNPLWVPNKGAGPGLTFAVQYRKEFNVPVGLVPCAHGGTSMDQWSPERKDQEGDSLYSAMLERFHAVGGSIAGLLWYQGESDAMVLEDANHYKEKMVKFIETVRRDLGNPALPMIYCQVGRCVSSDSPTGWNIVREAQRQIAESGTPNLAMVSTIDTELDDFIHVASSGVEIIGQRMLRIARAWELGIGPQNCPILTRITPQLFQFEHDSNDAGSTRAYLLLAFDNVTQWLDQRAFGFSIRDKDEHNLQLIHKVTFEEKSSIRLHLTELYKKYDGSQLQLWYGHGRNPICNVVDSDNMALPAFGPIDFELSFIEPIYHVKI